MEDSSQQTHELTSEQTRVLETIVPRVQDCQRRSGSVELTTLRPVMEKLDLYEDSNYKTAKVFPLGPKTKLLIGRQADNLIQDFLTTLKIRPAGKAGDPDGYTIAVTTEGVCVAGADRRGIYYGLLTLQTMVAHTALLDCLVINDWPDLHLRGLQLFHCMNQWSPIGADLNLMPHYKAYKEMKGERPGFPPEGLFDYGRPYIRFDEDLALTLLKAMSRNKLNTVMLIPGDSVRWKSCPEIALPDAWDCDRFRVFLDRIRGLHLDVMPALNFSPMHDTWLGKYHGLVDSPPYLKLVSGLIGEFASYVPDARIFHLGLDEEDEGHMFTRGITPNILRPLAGQLSHALFLTNAVEEAGLTAAAYADLIYDNRTKVINNEELRANSRLVEQVREKIILTEWATYSGRDPRITGVLELKKRGFRQIVSSYIRASAQAQPAGVARRIMSGLSDLHGIEGMLETIWLPCLDTVLMPEKRSCADLLMTAAAMSGAAFWNALHTDGIRWGNAATAAPSSEI